MHKVEKELIDTGYQIIAISPDRPEKLRETLDDRGLNYTLLSDSGMGGALAFGLAWRLGADILERYDGFGIDIEDASGETHHMLPVPAVYIVGADGTVQFEYVNPNHQVRIDPDVLLVAAKKAIK